MKQKIELSSVADERYLRPRAAAEKLKAAQGMLQTVYIYGTTGTGKTSLIRDFFSRRRYQYYSVGDCDASDIEVPEQEPGKQHIVVLDDLYLLDTAESRNAFYPLMEKLVERRDIWLILLSRCRIPKWLMPLYVRNIFVLIKEKDLCFTEKEQETYLGKWELSPGFHTGKRLRELGYGNPLYLRIAAMRLLSCQGPDIKNPSEKEKAEEAAIEASRRDLWDYVDSHVYDQWNLELQEFLMDISIVEQFDLQLAKQITKKSNTVHLILLAQETGNFLVEVQQGAELGGKNIWAYRTPMKLSMRRRLYQRCSETHIASLYYNAGSAYELKGDIPNALLMYEKSNDEEDISRLLIENMRKDPATGHYLELQKYYLALSEESICQSVELMAGMSMLQSILMNVEESEKWYQLLAEYEKNQTGSIRRMAQIRLLYLDIGLPHRGIIHMTDILKRAGALLQEKRTALPEMSVTNNQPSMMNGGKDFSEWSKKDRELAAGIGKIIEFVLGKYGKGLVNLALAESFLEKGGDSYEISTIALKGRLQAESGGKTEQVFVAVGILSWLSLLNNHISDAFEILNSFADKAIKDTPQLAGGIEALRIRFLLYAGRSGEVQEWMDTKAPDERSQFVTLERFRYMAKIRAYLAAGKKDAALWLAQKMLYYAEKMHRTYFYMEAKLLLAVIQYRMKDSRWKDTLQEAVTQAESYHFVRLISREGAAVYDLLKKADLNWKDQAFKEQTMKECAQMAAVYPAYLKEKQKGSLLLSDKAVKILRLQAEGYSVKQIAGELNLTEAGIKYYNRETYKKLGVRSKAAAVTEARNRKII